MIAYRLRKGDSIVEIYEAVAWGMEKEGRTVDPAICLMVGWIKDLAEAYAKEANNPKWQALLWLRDHWVWVQRLGAIFGRKIGDFPLQPLIAFVEWLVNDFDDVADAAERVIPCAPR